MAARWGAQGEEEEMGNGEEEHVGLVGVLSVQGEGTEGPGRGAGRRGGPAARDGLGRYSARKKGDFPERSLAENLPPRTDPSIITKRSFSCFILKPVAFPDLKAAPK